MVYGRYRILSMTTTTTMRFHRRSIFSPWTTMTTSSQLQQHFRNGSVGLPPMMMMMMRRRSLFLNSTRATTKPSRIHIRSFFSPIHNTTTTTPVVVAKHMIGVHNHHPAIGTWDRAASWEVFVVMAASAFLAMATSSYYYYYDNDSTFNALDTSTTNNTMGCVQCEGMQQQQQPPLGMEEEEEDELDGTTVPYATMSYLQTTNTPLPSSWKKMFFSKSEEEPPVGKEFMASTTVSQVEKKGTHTEQPYDVSVRAIKGGRLSMEDEYFVGDGGRFVAVFDGHGGAGVSQYLRKHLYDAVKVHLQKCHWEETELDDKTQASASVRPKNNPQNHSSHKIPSVFSHAAALKAAFAQIDKDVLANESLSYQGSTAVAVVVHEGEDGHRTLLSANVGDSRAILSRRGRAVDLTRDHKPNDEKEKARILAMGETIEWDQYSKVHRVRNLSLSRAIGDRYAKPVVTGEVEIKHYPVLADGDEFILLASDGLWDVMTSDEVVSFVHQRIKQELERNDLAIEERKNYKLVLRRNMAKYVAREAIRRGSGDNVCVIMVWLNDLHRKN